MYTTSLADWRSLIQKYIKDAKIEDYNHEVVDGLLYNAFAHKENTPDATGQILHSETTKLGITVDHGSNSSVLKALDFGTQALTFYINKDTKITDLLKGVNLNFIRACFVIDPDSYRDGEPT